MQFDWMQAESETSHSNHRRKLLKNKLPEENQLWTV